ncbi:MAG: class I SAM-dependent methyltransferase [Inquilinus limosus]|uniref:Class I SAM-dependent methyltransferase n=1 Tax=Inquilinus limosus TaxID=171674 RepID=A0A952FUV6_9PROT|nr:class I SAM-dependent methyltransferase [Inquilinus limosus]
MTPFSTAWLDLREPADHAARHPTLRSTAAALVGTGGLIVDLGCGTGSTVRALQPSLAPSVRWRLVDHDAAVLREAGRRTAAETILCDLSRRNLPITGASLVTASALLDLVSEAWIERLADALKARRSPFYAALSYDGRVSFDPAHPGDEAMIAALNAHQRTDKGFGPALGPDAAGALAAALRSRGFEVRIEASPWRLGPDDAALVAALLPGLAEVATGWGGIAKTEVENWLAFRQDRAAEGHCLVGHVDLLATL